jgi:hypothetical protein
MQKKGSTDVQMCFHRTEKRDRIVLLAMRSLRGGYSVEQENPRELKKIKPKGQRT